MFCNKKIILPHNGMTPSRLEMVIVQVSHFHYLCIKFCMDLVLDCPVCTVERGYQSLYMYEMAERTE